MKNHALIDKTVINDTIHTRYGDLGVERRVLCCACGWRLESSSIQYPSAEVNFGTHVQNKVYGES